MMKKRKLALQILSVSAAMMMGGVFFLQSGKESSSAANNIASAAPINKINGSLNANPEEYFDSSVMYKMPEDLKKDQEISVIVEMSTASLWDRYKTSDTTLDVARFAQTKEGASVLKNIRNERLDLIGKLNRSGVSYKAGATYDTLLSGFEIEMKAGDFEKVQNLLSSDATLILGDTYEKASTQVVENDVNVYDTGIFDSSSSQYQGNGVVIAVLDTGLDYTHTAFSVANFSTPDNDLAFTLGDGTEKDVAGKVTQTVASTFTAGLTGEDVYVSKKVPYAYDYADKDPDVLPINSEHGTHVAGIIAGKDDTITGAAPNAQLAIMKVFSDTQDGARTSWLLAALEDCVTLGVDVINMSLGSSCGFTREVDKENINAIYDKIKDAGISLIAAASNDYNATFGSTKNGNLGLTSNPDSGTVGSPATYDGALAVASISGVKTPYLLHGDDVIYFKEANDRASKPKNFVNEILSSGEEGRTFEYVVITGFGSAVDYSGLDMNGKIALVKRGTTSFEDKIRAATDAGAAGIVIYNNVSGEISMSVGAATAPACSISQDDGEALVAAANGKTGTISVHRSQVAGPFMSDFSSWGPTSDLKIKPEITAHGGDILSAIPGQGYDKLSGTSMAAPNQAGVTALIRQYVKEHVAADASDTKDVTALVNQIMMSTADIAYNKIGLPYAVRKQGAGLANLTKATTTPAYLTTFEGDKVMDKAKLELGDDKNKTGVYEMTFAINNITRSALSYNVDAIVMTEGVSKTYTTHGETTVTEEGYLLSGAKREVTSVSGNGSKSGNTVTVEAGGTLNVTVTVTLSEEDKDYLNVSFEHGMYVEGFVTLTAQGNNNIGLNLPFLAFYGDWTEAPIFDEEFYDTNRDELDAGIDEGDKVMADAYATRVVGTLYSDYISYLGSYYFIQDPATTQIAASKDKIALSNQNQGEDGNTAVNTISAVWAGLLRNAKHVDIAITEDSTGKTIFEKTSYNQRKSRSSGSTIYQSSIDIDFEVLAHELKNNTKYTVTLDAYIDYGEDGEQKNTRSRFEFPLFIDFEAPAVTDVNYRTVYDRINNTTRLYADISVYDNHYAMALRSGYVYLNDGALTLSSFGKYMTPVYSSFNSTSVVTVELTDYVNDLKNSVGISYDENGSSTLVRNNNSYVVMLYDYAMNTATYELRLPDDIVSIFFNVDANADKAKLNALQKEAGSTLDQTLVLSPNETFNLSEILSVYPSESWLAVLDYSVEDKTGEDVIGVVNGTVIARNSGSAKLTARGMCSDGREVTATLDVVVLTSEDRDLGYVKYDARAAAKFEVHSFTALRAFYLPSSSDRTIGLQDMTTEFGSSLSISMFPAEQIKLNYILDSYFPTRTSVTFASTRADVASVDENGVITAHHTANRDTSAYITVSLLLDGERNTSIRIPVTVKNPFINNAIYLMNYYGGGDSENCVTIPDDLGITTIYAYAFSGYEMVEKDLENGDEITEEDPYHLKQAFIGNDLIKKIVIPEGVTEIQSYAFANLSALEEVVLPSTLKKIGLGAFYQCKSLKTINLEHVQFINKQAFAETAIRTANFASLVSFGDYAFQNSAITALDLPASCQSFGVGAFKDCIGLARVSFGANKVKLGISAFENCPSLTSLSVNAAVIPAYAFYGCAHLANVTLGADVAVVGEYAFAGTKIARFNLASGNKTLQTGENGTLLYKGSQLIAAAPESGQKEITLANATSIATGAFSGNTVLQRITANNVEEVGDYAFADCTALNSVTMNKLSVVGSFAFIGTPITAMPNAENLKDIGSFAFSETRITRLTVPANAVVGAGAFMNSDRLRQLTVGNGVEIGQQAFAGTALTQAAIGENATIGAGAFMGLEGLTSVTLGAGAKIGSRAFEGDTALVSIDLSKATQIGNSAFFGAYALTSADLTEVETLGQYAFRNATSLTSVSFGDKLTYISAGAFMDCGALKSVTLGETITMVGDLAFYNSALETVNLENVEQIGAGAFAGTKLQKVTLRATGSLIDDMAFYGVTTLETAENLGKVLYIGADAFAFTALGEADLSSAVYVGDYAFEGSAITAVTFGVEVDENGNTVAAGNLEEIGENPFFNTAIQTYGVLVDVKFNGQTVDTKLTETYKISDTVEVIGGAIYSKIPSGLQLVSYPALRNARSYAVEEGTTRIGACAFAFSPLSYAEIASTVRAIGDKAFYGCGNLNMVVFKSLNAPTLEEEYDETYIETRYPLAYPGYFRLDNGEVIKNLEIVKYRMWNVITTDRETDEIQYAYSNFYFGANFVNYVGRVANKLTMVRPVNGRNYDSFIFGQYFNTVVTGDTAAEQATLDAIAAIAAIPENVDLSDECVALVNAARAAYDLVSDHAQLKLIENFSKLQSAEIRIDYLRDQQNNNNNPNPGTDYNPETNTGLLVGLIVPAVLIVAALIAVGVIFLKKSYSKKSSDGDAQNEEGKNE